MFHDLEATATIAEIEAFVAEVQRVIYDDLDFLLMAETLGKAEMYHAHRSIERERLFGEELGPRATDNPFVPPPEARRPFQTAAELVAYLNALAGREVAFVGPAVQ